MSVTTVEIDTIVVVLVGSFNPVIFQPRWLGEQDIIGKTEAEEASIEVIHPDTASFAVGKWLKVVVTRERFQASAPSSYALALRDFVTNVFRSLEHTPISVLGLNRAMHFRLTSQKARDALGCRLAPPLAWPDSLQPYRMASVRMQQTAPSASGSTRTVTVEPSALVKDLGVYVAVNESYPTAPERASDSAATAVTLMQTKFDEGVRVADELAHAIVTLGAEDV